MNMIPKTINPDLQKERNAASFNSEDFALWFHGGEEKLKFKRMIGKFENVFFFVNMHIYCIQNLFR